nr:hypothetical protein [Tanacetum cinerariifolium]
EMFDADKDLQGKEVVVEQEVFADKEPIVDVVQVSVATTNVTIDDITLAKALEDLKTSKPKIREIVVKDHEEPKSSKRARDKLEQESSKKQKIDDDTDTTELKQLANIISDEEGVAINAIPLAVKPSSIVG